MQIDQFTSFLWNKEGVHIFKTSSLTQMFLVQNNQLLNSDSHNGFYTQKNITTTPNLNDQPAKSNIDIVQTKNIFDGSITLINSTNTTFNMLSKSYFPKFSWVKHLQLRSFTFYKWWKTCGYYSIKGGYNWLITDKNNWQK